MAAAWFNRIADPHSARAFSAGTEPADRVHPVVIEAMKEDRASWLSLEARVLGASPAICPRVAAFSQEG